MPSRMGGSPAGLAVLAASMALVPSVQATARRAPLTFGVYPGGAAGTVGPRGRTVPDDPDKQLAALRELRSGDRGFVVRLYASYSGAGTSSPDEQVGAEVTRYTAAGFHVELALTYRPADRAPAADVHGYVAFVRHVVDAFGPNRDVVALQVTNEANIRNAPDAADGYYAGAATALVQGVIAAKERAIASGAKQLAVGFNWAYSLDPGESAFWRALDHGGAAFRRSVDWVGLDVYPLTWGPRSEGGDLGGRAGNTIRAALHALRARFMPLARLTDVVPIHLSECGYPTGPARSDAMQAAVLEASVSTVDSERSRFNVTGFTWFDLRDADSSSSSFENRYGLLRDDYEPKPAFAVYRHLVATLGV